MEIGSDIDVKSVKALHAVIVVRHPSRFKVIGAAQHSTALGSPPTRDSGRLAKGERQKKKSRKLRFVTASSG